ncbi:MAG: hypothetical protein M3393_04060 [Actinomycetota bacterium]|nr:hypothetical protein [Actinomycetota bacterium]
MVSVVCVALVCTLAAGLTAVLVSALVAGAPAALGAAIAVVMVCLFFALGAMVLDVVTTVAPAASLLVALLTYTLNVVLVGIAFISLSHSGALAGPVDAQWLGGTVIVCTLVWTLAQVVSSTRTRQPVYDLPSSGTKASVG